ncbi:MAG TPA: carboxylesterase family protein [Chitinophagaceae bacterium]|jgi:para-nitrobenzyl esterase|nr:carboxylesterase family protein [Chitinophagaceae bacterium]
MNWNRVNAPYVFFLTCLLFVPGVFAPAAAQQSPVVQVEEGQLRGTTEKDINVYKGIPFAAPPLGALRWKEPQPAAAWTGVRDATRFGPSPMQGKPAPFSMWTSEFLIPEAPISEDCLYLNVWSGARPGGEKLPVLVWIYGGGFVSGGSAVPIYDGAVLAAKGIVVVSINYRVGVFGFLAHPELTKESGRNASGNYGLMDQIAALRWIRENIAAFGGDPERVTIAGQSAGSMSVNCLVASPQAKGLFRRAIAQSGANFSRGMMSLGQAEVQGAAFAKTINAASLADLRTLPAEELLQKGGNAGRGPVVDGYILPATVAQLFEQKKQNSVALLTGWNEDEGLLFGPLRQADAYISHLEETYKDLALALFSYYPGTSDAEAAASQLKLSRDMLFGAQNFAWANKQALLGPVYVYRFTRKVPATGEYVKYGAFHTGEVPYAFNNLKFVQRSWKPVDEQLAQTMSDYWVNFVKTGNPNGAGLPAWPAYTLLKKEIQFLGETVRSGRIPDEAALEVVGQVLRGSGGN